MEGTAVTNETLVRIQTMATMVGSVPWHVTAAAPTKWTKGCISCSNGMRNVTKQVVVESKTDVAPNEPHLSHHGPHNPLTACVTDNGCFYSLVKKSQKIWCW